MESLDGRAKLVQMALPLLKTLPEGVFRNMMMERLETLARHRLNETAAVQSPVSKIRIGSERTLMRWAMAFLVQNPGLAELAGDTGDLCESNLPGVDIFLELVDFCRKRPNMTTAVLLELWRENDAYKHLSKLAAWPLAGDDELKAVEFADTVLRIRLQWVETQLGRIENPAKQREEYGRLVERKIALDKALQTS